MTASKHLKGLLAGVATVALLGTAMAQGNPPNPAVKSAPVGAGQQSTQQTPMGTTGTPTGGGTAAGSGSTSGSAASTGSTTTSGASTGSTSIGSGSTAADPAMSAGKTRPVRTARADRN